MSLIQRVSTSGRAAENLVWATRATHQSAVASGSSPTLSGCLRCSSRRSWCQLLRAASFPPVAAPLVQDRPLRGRTQPVASLCTGSPARHNKPTRAPPPRRTRRGGAYGYDVTALEGGAPEHRQPAAGGHRVTAAGSVTTTAGAWELARGQLSCAVFKLPSV